MPTSVYLLFDERMKLHRPVSDEFKPNEEGEDMIAYERPERIEAIHNRLLDLERRLCHGGSILSMPKPSDYLKKSRADHTSCRFVPLEAQFCNRRTIELAHSPEHYDRMLRTCMIPENEIHKLDVENDLYFCRDTFMASSLACGGVVRCVDAVTKAKEFGSGPTRAVALVRPPGHHATRDEAMGFCYFNNIAVAAKHAIHTGRAERVFILDWDIHHGNGIQDLTYDDPNIFYLSIHRASFHPSGKDWFYPGTGKPDEVGECAGCGTNLNICWNKQGMGNTEYAAAFSEVVLPLLSNFRADLIMIACGLDAAEGDLLGDAKLSPDMYHIMTKSLLETAGKSVPMVVALEGGYNLEVISTCMEAVALALLDEPWPNEKDSNSSSGAQDVIMMKSGRTKREEKSNLTGLTHYWKEETSKMSKVTKSAVKSMKKSAKALANNGTCLGEMHFIARSPDREDSDEESVDCLDAPSLQYHSFPVKKRKVVSSIGAVATLLHMGAKSAN